MGKVVMHWTYLEMVYYELEAIRHLDDVESKITQMFNANPDSVTQEVSELHMYHYMRTKRHSVIKVMILSAMTLEAFINNVAKQKLQKFEREALDKLDLAAKWVLIPKMAFGKGPDAGSHLIERIAAIQKERNFLVHAKPFVTDCLDASKPRPLDETRAHSAAQTCFDALLEIQEIDPTFEEDYFRTLMPDKRVIKDLISRAAAFEKSLV